MIHFINIDEVANLRIRKYSENLSISIFPLRERCLQRFYYHILLVFYDFLLFQKVILTHTLYFRMSVPFKCALDL
jgi:hypothetical protein